ncbi:MAG: hypothetical protein ACP5P4_14015 [Steroidobacteraceae bacterium]
MNPRRRTGRRFHALADLATMARNVERSLNDGISRAELQAGKLVVIDEIHRH